MKWFRSKTFWGGVAAITAGVVHLVVEVKSNGVGTVAINLLTGQYTETVTAIGAGLGLIGVRHALAKATATVVTPPAPAVEPAKPKTTKKAAQ